MCRDQRKSAFETDVGRVRTMPGAVGLGALCGLIITLLLPMVALAQPNIVVITSDDQNFRDFGYTGDGSIKDGAGVPISPNTPTIDAMFTQGVTFAMGHVPHAVCRPSLVSLMTGMNPVQNGVYGNDPVANGSALGWNQNQDNLHNNIMRRNVELNATLPRLLAERGYLCLQTGKWWEGDPKRAGFTHAEPGYSTTNAARHLHNYQDGGAGSIGRATNSVTTRIGAFVDQAIAADKPFFISYAPFLPHSPFNAPSIYTSRYAPLISAGRINSQQAGYLACIDWLDATIAELRALLQNRGVESDTVYVFLVDNGWLQPATGTIPSYGANGGKMTPFQNGVRTPIIFFQPGTITDDPPVAQKLADARLASSIDIMPTLLKLAGVEAPETLQGIDLLSGVALNTRRRCFGDSYKHDQDTMVSNQYRVGNPEGTLTSRWMIEDGWKLLLVSANPVGQSIGAATQLYNLRTDPLETVNLAATEPARVASMSASLLEWWSRTRPVYIYDHEFNGDGSSVGGANVDVRDSAAPSTAWTATSSGVSRNGTISGAGTAQLAFVPVANKRYELRVSCEPASTTSDGVMIGFTNGGAPSGGLAEKAVAAMRITRSGSGMLGVRLLANANGAAGELLDAFSLPDIAPADLYSLTLVLRTSDSDPALPGDQWSIALSSNGVERYRHVFTEGNPSIGAIGIGGLGSSSNATTDYIALVDVPLFPDAAGAVPRVMVDDLHAQYRFPSDWNNDGVIDGADRRDLEEFLRRNETKDMTQSRTER